MWLPREERQLLMFYTAYDSDFNETRQTFSLAQLQVLVTKRVCIRQIVERAAQAREANGDGNAQHAESQSTPNGDVVERQKSWLKAKGTLESANNRLRERGLAESRQCGTGYWEVKINLVGWDLGSKYLSFWARNCLWFREYKDHWIWLIVSFIGGVLGALVVKWLSS